MIQNLHTYTNQWLMINQSINQPHISPGSLSAGTLRYNPNTSCVEVYDGQSWFTFSGHAEVNLTPEAQRIMEWAQEKMKQEQELKALIDQHPGLRDLYEKFEIMKQLCLESDTDT